MRASGGRSSARTARTIPARPERTETHSPRSGSDRLSNGALANNAARRPRTTSRASYAHNSVGIRSGRYRIDGRRKLQSVGGSRAQLGSIQHERARRQFMSLEVDDIAASKAANAERIGERLERPQRILPGVPGHECRTEALFQRVDRFLLRALRRIDAGTVKVEARHTALPKL